MRGPLLILIGLIPAVGRALPYALKPGTYQNSTGASAVVRPGPTETSVLVIVSTPRSSQKPLEPRYLTPIEDQLGFWFDQQSGLAYFTQTHFDRSREIGSQKLVNLLRGFGALVATYEFNAATYHPAFRLDSPLAHQRVNERLARLAGSLADERGGGEHTGSYLALAATEWVHHRQERRLGADDTLTFEHRAHAPGNHVPNRRFRAAVAERLVIRYDRESRDLRGIEFTEVEGDLSRRIACQSLLLAAE